MATIEKDVQGVLDIQLIQGDDAPISLVFETLDALGDPVPLDLRTYSAIRLDVKSQKDVNEKPFISLSLGKGLTILGDNFNVLFFELLQQFNDTDSVSWFYDIKFTNAEGTKHLIAGSISIDRSVTK